MIMHDNLNFNMFNVVTQLLFGYELLPEEIKIYGGGDNNSKSSIDLTVTKIDMEMITSLYCYHYKDEVNGCDACPWSKVGGCEDSDAEKVLNLYKNWRSKDEIESALHEINEVRRYIITMMISDYMDYTETVPLFGYDEDRGYHIDKLFYFGDDVTFDNSDTGQVLMFGDVLVLPFDMIDLEEDIILEKDKANE